MQDHAMECFARLARVLMGTSALKQEKLQAGTSLDVLGLHIAHDEAGVHVHVTTEKAMLWSDMIEVMLKSGTLSAGDASKMAGRLSFAAQHTFKQAGRAGGAATPVQATIRTPEGRAHRQRAETGTTMVAACATELPGADSPVESSAREGYAPHRRQEQAAEGGSCPDTG